MNLETAIEGAKLLAFRQKTTVIVHWKGGNAYGYATETRLLGGRRKLNRWRYRVHPEGKVEKL